MAQSKDDGADQAYEAAAEKLADSKPEAVKAKPKAPRKAKAAVANEVAPAAQPEEAKAAPATAEPVVEKPAPAATRKARTPAKRAASKPVAKKRATKPAPKKAATAKVAAATAPKSAAVASKPAKPKIPAAAKLAKAAIKAPAKTTTKFSQEFVKMTTPEEMTKGFQDAMADMTAKTKAAYEKGTELFSDAGEFTKGNVEAIVESSKIFASGIQEMGRSLVADSKAEFEALTAEVKELAAVKSPTDFFQLQSAMLRKYFDKSVAAASKNTEAMLKLANDAAQPLSSRVSVAVEKIKAA